MTANVVPSNSPHEAAVSCLLGLALGDSLELSQQFSKWSVASKRYLKSECQLKDPRGAGGWWRREARSSSQGHLFWACVKGRLLDVKRGQERKSVDYLRKCAVRLRYQKDPRPGSRYGRRIKTCGWSREETLVQGSETNQKTRCHPSSHQESFRSPWHQHLAVLQFWSCGHGHFALHDARHQIARCGCSVSQVWWGVTSSIAIGLPHNADPAVQAEIECVKQWLVFWHNDGEFVRTRVRRAWRLSLQQLRDGSSRWVKVRGPTRAVMCVLLTLVGSPLHQKNRKQAGGDGVYWSFTGVGDSADVIQVLSRDILPGHWARAASRWDGAGLERGCNVSVFKQHLRFLRNVRTMPCMVRC